MVEDPLPEPREQRDHPSATREARRAASTFCGPSAAPVGAGKIEIAPGGSRMARSVTSVDVNTGKVEAHGSTTAAPDASPTIASSTSGAVVFSPSRFSFPSPW